MAGGIWNIRAHALSRAQFRSDSCAPVCGETEGGAECIPFFVIIHLRGEDIFARDVFASEAKQSQREIEEIAIPREAGLRSSQ